MGFDPDRNRIEDPSHVTRLSSSARFSMVRPVATHAFRHPDDTFAFRNETLWSYSRDPVTGRQRHEKRDPPPDYHLRCFVMARSAKQFFAHAEFDPGMVRLEPGAYGHRIREVVDRSPRSISADGERVLFPGYANLREFSLEQKVTCKEHLGAAWQSYLQRGHWRMVMPYTRRGQHHEALRLLDSVRAGRAPVVHVFTFPALTLNHAILAFEARETSDGFRFLTYDPNSPDTVLDLDFNLRARRFRMPPTEYFLGGDIDAFEVYCGPFL